MQWLGKLSTVFIAVFLVKGMGWLRVAECQLLAPISNTVQLPAFQDATVDLGPRSGKPCFANNTNACPIEDPDTLRVEASRDTHLVGLVKFRLPAIGDPRLIMACDIRFPPAQSGSLGARVYIAEARGPEDWEEGTVNKDNAPSEGDFFGYFTVEQPTSVPVLSACRVAAQASGEAVVSLYLELLSSGSVTFPSRQAGQPALLNIVIQTE
ncbi:hypothetical protein IWQ61_003382 [Dispira simplex]|nr:hypothetical protein IWQ61_003382 [Dispira simplex]